MNSKLSENPNVIADISTALFHGAAGVSERISYTKLVLCHQMYIVMMKQSTTLMHFVHVSITRYESGNILPSLGHTTEFLLVKIQTLT